MEFLDRFVDARALVTDLVGFVPAALTATAVLVLFWALLRFLTPGLKAVLERADFESALVNFLVDDVLRLLVWALGIVMAVSQLGVNVSAALAGLGVAGVAVGFAAQDSLANTISGFLIFWDKPFRVGDFISSQGKYGRVTEITMRTTRIRTQENTYVVIPNKLIIDDPLVNHSMYGETRVNVPIGIAYKEDVQKAREVLLGALEGVSNVLAEPAPDVVLTELADSSVNLELRVWIPRAELERSTFFSVLERGKTALDEAAIEIPFPHLQLFVDSVEERVWKAARVHFTK